MRQVFLFFAMLIIPICMYSNPSQNDGLIDQIITHEEYCVHSYAGDKIYLNPDSIHVANGLIYIDFGNGSGIALPSLNYDSLGEYVIAHSMFEFRCPGCGRIRRGPCKTAGCPNNPNTPEAE